jgi:GTP pyrophosphokinase
MVVTLAAGATPIDFAYAIHTEVGHACIGARVNGRLQPLDSTLQSGDTVEIFTSKVEHGPSRDWLSIAVTPRARNKIRQWFSRERREDALETGKDELARALRREGMPVQKIMSGPAIHEIAAKLSYTDVDMLLIAIGENHVSAKSVAQRIGRDLRQGDGEEQLPITARAPQRRRKPTAGVHVEGLDDVMVRLSRCCTPVPGDDIMGFVTRGRGVPVHRTDCSNAVSLSSEQGGRLIDVEWDRDHGMDTYVVSIEVRALDRARLLRDVAAVLGDHHVSVLASQSQTSADRTSRMRFDFELADPSHLDSLLASLRQVDSVYDAYRLLPGANTAS